MQKFLKESHIRFRVTRNPDIKAAVVKRFNKTLKEQMWRYFTHKNTRHYIDVLQDIVRSYNHMRHSSTRMQPAIVTRENARSARENIAHWRNNDTIKKYGRKTKYHVGDLIRVRRVKDTFEKKYEAKWSEEIFRIHRVFKWRKSLVYELSDLASEVIDSIFYKQELARVKKNLQEEEFVVNYVVKSRGRDSNKQLLISWRDYPSKFDTWIPASSLTHLWDEGGTISHGSSEQ